MKTLLSKYWPILIIFLVVIAFAYPYLAKGLVPFPAAYLADFFPPWNAYYGHPVKNNAMPDVISQIYPWRKLVVETFKIGQWPLWNPFNFAGTPHLANFQSAAFSPFNWLFWILPTIDAWSLMILLQPLLAGLFTYLLCRRLKISRAGATISALAFGFCGFMVVWMAYGTLGWALLWLPLILWGIDKNAQKINSWGTLAVTFGIGFSFFSGHFQISVYVVAAAGLYLLFRKAWPALLAFGLGVGLAMPQILPSIEFYRLAPRSDLFSASEVIPWQYLITILAPDFYGNPVTRNDWFGHYAEWAGFIGVIPLILAFWALVRNLQAKKKSVWFFSFLAFSALLLALPTPLMNWLVKLKVPVLATSAASRVISVFGFAMSVLAGLGLDRLKKDLTIKKLRPKLIAFLGCWGLLFLGVWGIIMVLKPFPPEWAIVARRNFILPTAIFGALSGLIFSAWFTPKIIKKKKFLIADYYLPITFSAILLLTAFDLFRFAHKWMPFDPREWVYPQNPAVEYLSKQGEVDRIFGNFGTEAQVYFHLPAVEGYDPLYLKRYGELISAAGDGQISSLNHRTVLLNKNGQYTERLLKLLGVKYIWHTISDGRHVWAFPYWQYLNQFELVYQDEKHQVYRNEGALPRAFLVNDYEVVKESQAIIDRLFAEDFDLAKTVILEEAVTPPPGWVEVLPGGGGKSGRSSIVKYSPTQIVISAQTPQPAILFLSDNDYPGWKALVDGQESKVYRANYSFRAVFVPEGNHEVRFIYEPQSFKIGLLISGLSFIFLLAITLGVNLPNTRGWVGRNVRKKR